MDPFAAIPAPTITPIELHDLAASPSEEWQRMLRFLGLNETDRQAISRSAEVLLQRAHEMVVNIYAYLSDTPETAAILGWETKIDESHLEERRRFFTMWLTRAIGVDTSDEFANTLFKAGIIHAAHGPRKIHVPPIFITGAVGLVLANFSQFMYEGGLSAEVISAAMASWNKYLLAQLHMMHYGYEIARDFDRGRLAIDVTLYGKIRAAVGQTQLTIHANHGDSISTILRKFFNYYPQTHAIALERSWHEADDQEALWLEVTPIYKPKGGYRILKNGRNVGFSGDMSIADGDTVAIFPPGR